jgi:N-acylneuraminate cytidylyltransferase
MIEGETVLAVVIARGGSKGIPRKNVRSAGGKPLIAWTLEAARRSQFIDRLVLSSEDAEIISVAKQWGCEVPFVRSAKFATDEVTGVATVIDATTQVEHHDWVMMLQPTSPFRTAADIDGCVRQCIDSGANACVTVAEVEKTPYWMFSLSPANTLVPVMRDFASVQDIPMYRQSFPKSFVLNGAVYVARTEWLRQTGTFVTSETQAYVMPRERSLDVDTELDWMIMEMLMSGDATR